MWDTRNQTLNTTMGIYQHCKVKVREKSTKIKDDRITTVSSSVATLQHKQRKIHDGFLLQTFQPLHNKTDPADSLKPFSITTTTMVGFKPWPRFDWYSQKWLSMCCIILPLNNINTSKICLKNQHCRIHTKQVIVTLIQTQHDRLHRHEPVQEIDQYKTTIC